MTDNFANIYDGRMIAINFQMKYFSLVIILLSFYAEAQTIKNPSTLVPRIDTMARTAALSVIDFGAHTGNFDNSEAFKLASDYLIKHPNITSSLYIPPGSYFQSKPWILQNVVDGKWEFFHIHIFGNSSAKSSPDPSLTIINCGFSDGFGIGVQYGRDVEIQNIAIVGKYKPPPVDIYNIGSTLYSAWDNSTGTDTRYAPNCGIAIDPFCDSNHIAASACYVGMRSQYLPNTGRGGTSGMKIVKCRINNFPVGIVLTPNGYTQNDENIDIIDDNIYACKVSIAIGQDQSKNINIDRLQSWGPTYTVMDGLRYGTGTGGGSANCSKWNVAGCVNQLFNITTSRFSLSCRELYAESLFRIGNVGMGTVANFENCEFDFLCGAGIPAADYIIAGRANFNGGTLRYYDNSYTHRMNLNSTTTLFRDMTLNNYPIVTGLYGIGVNHYPGPKFDNVNYFYNRSVEDTITQIIPHPNFIIDRTKWTASFAIANGYSSAYKVGDYILGSPTSTTRTFFDRDMYNQSCNTIQIGRVTSVSNNIVFLDDVAVNAYNGLGYDAVYICRLR
jgi:hypothetical protein